MKDEILIALAERWEREAKDPMAEDGSDHAKIGNAQRKGGRDARKVCAGQLRSLVEMLGDKE